MGQFTLPPEPPLTAAQGQEEGPAASRDAADLHTDFTETADIETSSDDYARRFAGSVGEWFLALQRDATLRLLAPYPRARILDVGGGHGQLAGAFVREGYDVTVLGSAEVCRQRIQQLVDADRCAFKVGDVLHLPYPDRSFDIVASYRLLPHVTRWRELLAELARVARVALVIDYPSVRSVNYIAPQLFKLKKQMEGNTRPYTCFHERELIDALKPAGFAPTGRYAEFFLPMVLHRTLKAPRLSAALEWGFRMTGLTHLFGSPVILKLNREEGWR